MARFLHRLVAVWVHGAWRLAPLVILLALLGGVAATWVTVERFRISTDRTAMLDAELPFRRGAHQLEQIFPELADTIVVVIDAPDEQAARAAARALAGRLARQSETFGAVDLGGAEPFFERQAWLYLPRERLADVVTSVEERAPALVMVADDPTPGGIFALIERRMRARELAGDDRAAMLQMLAQVAAGVDAALAGARPEARWAGEIAALRGEAGERLPRAVVLVQPRLDYGHLFAARDAIARIRSEAAAIGITAAAGFDLRLTGGPVLAHQELRTVARGMGWIGALVGAMVVVILFLALRSLRMVAATLLTLVIGLTATACFAMVVVGSLNLVSVVFGVLYLGLGVDYAIHLGMRYRELLPDYGQRLGAMQEAIDDVGGSLAVCAVTTCIGFLAFVPTAYVGVSELGLIAAAGMVISLVLSLCLLPALLRYASPPPGRPLRQPRGRHLQERFAAAVASHRRGILVGSVLVVLAALIFAPHVRFDANTLNLRDPNSEAVTTLEDLLADRRVPPWTARMAVPEAQADAVVAALNGLPEVARVLHLDAFLPSDQAERLARRDQVRALIAPALASRDREPLPEVAAQVEAARDLAWLLGKARSRGVDRAEVVALAEAMSRLEAAFDAADEREQARLLEALDRHLLGEYAYSLGRIADLVDVEEIARSDLPADLRERWQRADYRRIEAVPAEDILGDWAAMERFADAVTGVVAEAAGSPVAMVTSGRVIWNAFLAAMLYAAIACTLVLAVLLHRARDVILVLIPLAAATALTLGAMAVLGIDFNFANVIALPLLLGIGVDNAVHMVHRARLEAGRGIAASQTSTARAVLFSSLTTACSFGNLALSEHPGTASMGQLLFVGVTASLAVTLVLVPALVRVVPPDPVRSAQSSA